MTKHEFQEEFLVVVGALWPALVPKIPQGASVKEKREAQEKVGLLWGMFNRHPVDAAIKAVRQAAVEYPTPPARKSWLWVAQQARDLLPKKTSVSQSGKSMEERIREHREHYAGCKGWQYPGDLVIQGYIERGELTPLQIQTFKDMAQIMKDACKGVKSVQEECSE